ncbi:MAG: metal ABC transporter solute-binding protein, Zn/Mn family, partial [Candidatus Levyibacteriota bacterium]
VIGALIILAIFGFILAKSNSNNSLSNSGKLQVTTSFYPLYYFASQIGGNKADVRNITPPGAEPHDYEPSTQDMARIENSDILILNGGVEAWGKKIQDNLKGEKTLIVTAGQNLLTQTVTENGSTQTDPHVWLDPVRAKAETRVITSAFVKADPKDEAYFQNNEKALDSKLDTLDQKFKIGLASCTEKNIITSHAAFGYLASRYGLTQVPISGLSPDAEPSLEQLASISDFAKKNNVKYIFFEALVSPKLADTIAHEVGAKTLVLDPIEGVSATDANAGKNYYTIMEQNLKNLQIALQCKS